MRQDARTRKGGAAILAAKTNTPGESDYCMSAILIEIVLDCTTIYTLEQRNVGFCDNRSRSTHHSVATGTRAVN